jgi:hypothetical protein
MSITVTGADTSATLVGAEGWGTITATTGSTTTASTGVVTYSTADGVEWSLTNTGGPIVYVDQTDQLWFFDDEWLE